MFNKKLKKRIESLEGELGYAYDVNSDYYSNLTDGDVTMLGSKVTALIDYLNLTNSSASYKSFRFVKKDAKDGE